MKRTHLPLNALRVFEAAARHLSFTRAADELAVTPAAVGQQIRALEETLGVILFRRLTRNLELTPEAAAALPALRQGFAGFEAAVEQLQANQSSKVLTVAAPRELAAGWLTHQLAAYGQLHPDLRFVVNNHAGGAMDFAQANLDLAIWYGTEPEAEGIHGKVLGPEEIWLVARPDLPQSADCIAHPLDPETLCAEPALTMADAGLALGAALVGLGQARVPALLAATAIASTQLEVRSRQPADPAAWWVCAPTPQWRSAKVRGLVAFLAEAYAAGGTALRR